MHALSHGGGELPMSLFYMLLLQAGTVERPPAEQSASSSSKARPVQPVGNPAGWVTQDDYPAEALKNRLEGSSNFTITVDTQGSVESCSAVGPFESLNVTTCDLIRERGRFTPARDALGRPIKAAWSRTVRWKIPEGTSGLNLQTPINILRQMKQGLTTVITMTIEKDGTISHCDDKSEIDGKPQKSIGPCAQMPKKIAPLIDANGSPTRERIELRTEMTRKVLP